MINPFFNFTDSKSPRSPSEGPALATLFSGESSDRHFFCNPFFFGDSFGSLPLRFKRFSAACGLKRSSFLPPRSRLSGFSKFSQRHVSEYFFSLKIAWQVAAFPFHEGTLFYLELRLSFLPVTFQGRRQDFFEVFFEDAARAGLCRSVLALPLDLSFTLFFLLFLSASPRLIEELWCSPVGERASPPPHTFSELCDLEDACVPICHQLSPLPSCPPKGVAFRPLFSFFNSIF